VKAVVNHMMTPLIYKYMISGNVNIKFLIRQR